jgi:fumarate hydratase class II
MALNSSSVVIGYSHSLLLLLLSQQPSQVRNGIRRCKATVPALCELALGGTAVGTGLHTDEGYAQDIAESLATETGLPLVTAPNKVGLDLRTGDVRV